LHGYSKEALNNDDGNGNSGGSRGRVQDDLRLSNTVIQNLLYPQQLTLFALPKAFFFVLAFKIRVHHQSVMPFLSGAPPPKKNPGSAPGQRQGLPKSEFALVQT